MDDIEYISQKLNVLNSAVQEVVGIIALGATPYQLGCITELEKAFNTAIDEINEEKERTK